MVSAGTWRLIFDVLFVLVVMSGSSSAANSGRELLQESSGSGLTFAQGVDLCKNNLAELQAFIPAVTSCPSSAIANADQAQSNSSQLVAPVVGCAVNPLTVNGGASYRKLIGAVQATYGGVAYGNTTTDKDLAMGAVWDTVQVCTSFLCFSSSEYTMVTQACSDAWDSTLANVTEGGPVNASTRGLACSSGCLNSWLPKFRAALACQTCSLIAFGRQDVVTTTKLPTDTAVIESVARACPTTQLPAPNLTCSNAVTPILAKTTTSTASRLAPAAFSTFCVMAVMFALVGLIDTLGEFGM